MSSGYTIRNYLAGDFDALAHLKNEAAALAADGRNLTPQAVHNALGRPSYSPEQDLFVADTSGAVVGYLDITAELRIGRVIFEGMVLPEHRQRGVAQQLYCRAETRAKALGAKVAHVNLREDNSIARLVLEKVGFRPVRCFYELTIDLDMIPETKDPTTFPMRPLGAGEGIRLADIQNRCYAGSWGYNPNTAEEIGYAAGNTVDSNDEICLALDGDRPVGYFWVRIERDRQGRQRGRFSMLGTDPDYRGRGIGKELLLAGLACLKGRGLRVAQLTVDSENLVARALYRSIGFQQSDTSLWYEKALG